ncbi:hypothetical protein [Rhizobium sp. SGZ-381]|uniref:hypothetical protein n=1 Tax=Rhizobium sp. SGZ-381 TaxID=3342800 RepID=UPI0036716A46
MESSKAWYQSKAVWGGLIAIAASVLQATGTEVSPVAQGDLTAAATSLAGAVGGLLAVYGRLSAKTSITGN